MDRSPPLDLNSKYAYHLVARHFAGTSVVVREEGSPSGNLNPPVGFVSGYLLPHSKHKTLFVWQVALLSKYRGRGLAVEMLLRLLARKELADIEYIHTTISPSNDASKNLFLRLAEKIQSPVHTEEFLREEDFLLPHSPGAPGESPTHETEILYKIGPIKPHQLMDPQGESNENN